MIQSSHLAENIIEIYKKHARKWTQLRGEFLYEKTWLDQFLSLTPEHSHILDLGCGSGKPIAQYCIELGYIVTGVDSSEVMLELAQQNFPLDFYPKNQWIHADMRKVELKQKFQGILAWDSFFHLTQDDQKMMFQQFETFAEHGAVLMFTSGPVNSEAVGDLFGDALLSCKFVTRRV